MTPSRPQDIGGAFEQEFAERHGLKPVAASGSQWHSKLDANGRGARWSLKATKDVGYRIKPEDLVELLSAHAPGESGEMRLMGICIGYGTEYETTVVLMLEEDFESVAQGETVLVVEDKTKAKRRRAATPQLLREEDEDV